MSLRLALPSRTVDMPVLYNQALLGGLPKAMA